MSKIDLGQDNSGIIPSFYTLQAGSLLNFYIGMPLSLRQSHITILK